MSADSRWDSRFNRKSTLSDSELTGTNGVLSQTRDIDQSNISSDGTIDLWPTFDVNGIIHAAGTVRTIDPVSLKCDIILGQGSSFLVTREILSVPFDDPIFVAVKHVRVRQRSPQLVRRAHRSVMRELRVLSHPGLLGHACITRVLGYGWKSSPFYTHDPYIVVEYSDFGTLSEFIAKTSPQLLDLRQYALDVAIGVKVLHEHGFIHGDIKTRNVLMFGVENSGSDPRTLGAKLADFGNALSKADIEEDHARPWGTTIYTAPEILLPTDTSTIQAPTTFEDFTKAEVFSFGLLLWEVLKAGKTYLNEWELDSGEDELGYRPRLCGAESDVVLRKALQYWRTRRWFYTSASSIELFQIFEDTLKLCLKDDFNHRAHISDVVKCLAKGTSETRTLTRQTTRFHKVHKDYVPGGRPLKVVATPSKLIKNAQLPYLHPDETPEAISDGKTVFRRLNKLEHPSKGSGALVSLHSDEYKPFSEPFTESQLDIFKASLATWPPWEVQHQSYREFLKLKESSLPGDLQAYAAFQLSACFYTGFGVRPDVQEVVKHLTEASTHNLVAAALCPRVVEALANDSPALARYTYLIAKSSSAVTSTEAEAGATDTTNQLHFSCRFQAFQSQGALQLAEVLQAGQDVDNASNVLSSVRNGIRGHCIASACFTAMMTMGPLSFKEYLSDKYFDQSELSSCLNLACRYGKYEAAVALATQCHVYIGNDEEPNPLHWLSSLEHQQAVSLAGLLVKGSPITTATTVAAFNNGVCAAFLNACTESSLSFPEHAMELFGTPLHWAVRTGNLPLVRILVELGADMDIRWPRTPTVLYSRMYKPHEPALSPLDLAVMCHHADMAEFLLKQGAATHGGEYALEHTCFHVIGHPAHPFARFVIHGGSYRMALIKTINVLQKHGIDINGRLSGDFQITPLEWALTHLMSEEYIVEGLVQCGAAPAQVDDKDEDGSEDGDTLANKIVRLSCDRPFTSWKLRCVLPFIQDLNKCKNKGYNALQLCAILGSDEMASLLLSSGHVDVEMRYGTASGPTSLIFAATFGHVKMVVRLLENGAQIDNGSSQGTALRAAVAFRQLTVIKILIDYGANIFFGTTCSEVPSTVLHDSVLGMSTDRNQSIVAQVLEQNPKLRHSSVLDYQIPRRGWTALHQAVAAGDVAGLKALLSAGANPNITNDPQNISRGSGETMGTPIEITRKLLRKFVTGTKFNLKPWLFGADPRDMEEFKYCLEEIETILEQSSQSVVGAKMDQRGVVR